MTVGQAHLVHPMRSTRVPRRFVFLDTEARRTRVGGVEHQTWRLGCTSVVTWDSHAERWGHRRAERHATPESLWRAVTGAAQPSTRTVVVAHNLGYDLRISRALEILPAWGWQVDKLVVSPEHVGLDLVNGPLRLVLVDSLATLPVGLARLGEALCYPKGTLPPDEAPDGAFWPYCERDVEILERAYLAVVNRLRDDDLGCWARTGSGLAWNTYLRRFCGADKVLVHSDDELRQAEMDAAHAQRCEAWRWGKLPGAWHEWDHELAYAHVLADETLPAYHLDEVRGLTMRHLERTYPATRWLVHARVVTEAPVLPVSLPEGTAWPVGTFEGWWWDAELLTAAREGARVELATAHRYRGERWLASWAEWCLDLCAGPAHGDGAVLAIAAKHWQRALVGRSAMRWRDWHEAGDAWSEETAYVPMLDADTGELGAAFHLGGRKWETWERIWHDNALPQLYSAVMAHCRVRLWHEMRVAGLDHVAYCDTDALIVDDEGDRRLAAAVAAGELGSLRRKATWRGVKVHAPKYLEALALSRIAGVPRNRRKLAEHHYRVETWESLTGALAHGRADEVLIRDVQVTVEPRDWRRLHLPGGQTEAVRVVDGARVELEEGTA